MARKGWDQLSTSVRRRYERAGVTRDYYESGGSLSKARGHSATPERPDRADRNPRKYRGYMRRNVIMKVATTDGPVLVTGMEKEDRSKVGSHYNAIHNQLSNTVAPRYDGFTLDDLTSTRVTGYRIGSKKRERFSLETNPNVLEYYGSTGQLQSESIYVTRKSLR